MYLVDYYLKDVGGCQMMHGFSDRETAWQWVKEQGENIEWYRISTQSICN